MIINQLLTFIIVAFTAWSGYVAYKTMQIIRAAKKIHGTIRRSDKVILLTALIALAINIGLVIYHPKLLFSLPGVLALIEVGISSTLFYLHELQSKNWKNFKECFIEKH